MRGHSWSNVFGTISFDVEWNDLEDEKAKNPYELQLLVIDALVKKGHVNINPQEEFEYMNLFVEFTSTGYDDPGQISGPAEDCYPPDGDDEREMVSVSLATCNHKIELDKDLAGELFEKYYSKIMEGDIEYGLCRRVYNRS